MSTPTKRAVRARFTPSGFTDEYAATLLPYFRGLAAQPPPSASSLVSVCHACLSREQGAAVADALELHDDGWTTSLLYANAGVLSGMFS